MTDALPLVRAIADPATTSALDGEGWTNLIGLARAEQLMGTLAHRLSGLPKPAAAERLLAAARDAAEVTRTAALWEAEMARRALAPLGVPVILLKGTAYAAAGLSAGVGRAIGDLDVLVPRAALDGVEAALLDHGWDWVKPDPYDDLYYRRWMHELPPLIHGERDRMIDVHHTILPPTARITPDAVRLVDDSVDLGGGLRVLCPQDMVLHAAAHLFADGDLQGGLRNLWDIRCLLGDFGEDSLAERAALHGLTRELARARRLAAVLYGNGVETTVADRLYLRRLLGRDGWGRPTRPATQMAFYVRSHWLRMPPLMLMRHLWTKWRKGGRASG